MVWVGGGDLCHLVAPPPPFPPQQRLKFPVVRSPVSSSSGRNKSKTARSRGGFWRPAFLVSSPYAAGGTWLWCGFVGRSPPPPFPSPAAFKNSLTSVLRCPPPVDATNQNSPLLGGGSGAPRSWCHRPMRLVVLGFCVGLGGRRRRRRPRLSLSFRPTGSSSGKWLPHFC